MAEKVEAMVQLGLANSRMKDYYDIWILMQGFAFDGDILKRSMVATFTRRETALPSGVPPGRSDEFAADRQKHSQWTAFVRRTHARMRAEADLKTVVVQVREFLLPRLLAAGQPQPSVGKWPKRGPWQT